MGDREIRQIAKLMLQDLTDLKLTVIAVPDGRPNSSRKVRCVVVPNPEWYSRMCQQYVSKRRKRWKRERTIIKRCDTVKALERIIENGVNARFAYDVRVLDAIEFCSSHERYSL